MNDVGIHESLSSIARTRELGLKAAGEAKMYLEEIMAGLGSENSERELARFKDIVIPKLIDRAEAHYLASIRGVAMTLMEHDRKLSADGALASAESMILHALGIS
jgi:hypothetical protein